MASAYDQELITAIRTLNGHLAELCSKSPDFAAAYAAGQVRTAGGKITFANTAVGVFQLLNPAGSGKVVTLRDFSLSSDTSVDVNFTLDGTVNVPTTLAPFLPNRASSNTTTVGQTRSGITGLTGGTSISPVFRVAANTPGIAQQFTVVLLPGQSIAARVTSPAVATVNFYASGTWTES